jgi:hypothetical protein
MTSDSQGSSGGRPSTYTREVADAICEHIAHGKSLVSYCSQDGTPGYSTVMRWLTEDETFRENYTRAREAQADYLAEDVVNIADEEVTMVKRSKHQHGASAGDDTDENEVEVVFDPTAVARNRLRVDARKWYAARMAPKKYGDKVQMDADVKVGGSIEHTHSVSDATSRLLEDLSGIGADRSATPPVQD